MSRGSTWSQEVGEPRRACVPCRRHSPTGHEVCAERVTAMQRNHMASAHQRKAHVVTTIRTHRTRPHTTQHSHARTPSPPSGGQPKSFLRESEIGSRVAARDPASDIARRTTIAARPPTPYSRGPPVSGLPVGFGMRPGPRRSSLTISYKPNNGISVRESHLVRWTMQNCHVQISRTRRRTCRKPMGPFAAHQRAAGGSPAPRGRAARRAAKACASVLPVVETWASALA